MGNQSSCASEHQTVHAVHHQQGGHPSTAAADFQLFKCTKLFRLVHGQEWEKAIERSQRYPEECRSWVRTGTTSTANAKNQQTKKNDEQDNKNKNNNKKDASNANNTQDDDVPVNITILPIHLACYLGPPANFILSQLQAYPQAVQKMDDYDRLPLHLACLESAGLDVIKTLLFWQPRCALAEDKNGCLPVHLAILAMYSQARASVEVEVEVASKTTEMNNVDKYMYDTVRILELLLKAYPDGAMHQNVNGDTPLGVFRLMNEVLRKVENNGRSTATATAAGDEWVNTIDELLRRDVGYWRSVRPTEVDDIVADYLADEDRMKNGLKSFSVDLMEDYPAPFASAHVTSAVEETKEESPTSFDDGNDDFNSNSNSNSNVNGRVGNGPGLVSNAKDSTRSFGRTNGDSRKTFSSFAPHSVRQTSPLNTWITMADWDEVETCAKKYPEQAQDLVITDLSNGSTWARLPLHEACRLKAPKEAIQTLVKAYPQGAESRESLHNRLPIHIACAESAPDDVIKILLDTFPKGAEAIEDKYSGIPLHFACSNGASVEVVLELLRAFSGACQIADKDGWLPLHHACAKGASEQVVEVLLCSYPEASKVQESLMGRVPLHFAAWKGTSTAVVDTLMKVAPEAASISNFFGSTPLEIVEKNSSPAKRSIRASLTGELSTECNGDIHNKDELLSIGDITKDDGNRCRPVVTHEESEGLSQHISMKAWDKVAHMAEHYPKMAATWTESKLGDGSIWKRLPIHEAIRLNAPQNVIFQLAKAYSEGVSTRESMHNQLPIHLACSRGAPEAVIQILLGVYPGSAKKQSKNRLLPVHLACANDVSMKGIQAILSAYPDGIREKDNDGWLPIHHACAKGASEEVVSLLLESFPESSHAKEVSLGRLPIHLAAYKGATTGVVQALLQAYPDSVSVGTFTGSTPIALAQRSSSLSKYEVIDVLNSSHSAGATPQMKHVILPPPTFDSNIETVDSAPLNIILRDESNNAARKEKNFSDINQLTSFILKREWNSALSSLKKGPVQAGAWNKVAFDDGSKWRRLPLHEACRLQPPTKIVEELIAAFPAAIKTQDHDGWLPLHLACECSASENVISTILNAWPDAARAIDTQYGYLPLHIACCFGSSENVIEALIRAFPQSLRFCTHDGIAPLTLVRHSTNPNKASIIALLQSDVSRWL